MDFLKQFLSDQTGPLIERLTAATGFKAEEAQAFVPAALTQVVEQLKGGETGPAVKIVHASQTNAP